MELNRGLAPRGPRTRAPVVLSALAVAIALALPLRMPMAATPSNAEPTAHASSANSSAETPWRWSLPRGFPRPYVPPDNPMSVAKVDLGRRLFFEPRLSITGRHHCGSCHEPARAYTDGRATAIGATGGDVGRAAMSLANVAYLPVFGWFEGGADTLEAQMRRPLYNEHPVELGLGGREREVLGALAADPEYAASFARAFPGEHEPVTVDNLVRAIAAFERTLISGDSPFDRYAYAGRHEALDASAKRGMELFYSARLGCADCHGGFAFTGTARDAAHPAARPAYANTGTSDRAVRVPTLRNVAVTAPYMHDGRYATLDDVIAHYERVGAAPGARRGDGPALRAFRLVPEERTALVAFLRALTDPAFLADPATEAPHARER